MRLLPAVIGTALIIAACGGGKGAPAPAASARAPATAAVAATTATADADALSRLTLAQADVPPELQLTAKHPFSNKDYASMQTDAAAFQKKLDDAGRLDGAFAQYLNNATVTPPPNTPVVLGIIDIVSNWRDVDAAKAGLATTLDAVQPASSMPNAIQVATTDVDLGSIGDDVTARQLHATSLVPGQTVGDAFVVGLRRGSKTALLIVSGVNGAPSIDQVKQLAQKQSQRLG